jgi:chemotaxis protein methyltransferase CheR
MAFTYFFRDYEVLDLAAQHVVPALAGRSRPTVWDAGCAMGPEPYTLAILLAERMGRFAFRNLRIHATDIDETGQFGQIVRQGVYPAGDLERMPPGIRDRFFVPAGQPEHYRVNDALREAVHFQQHDLLSLREIGTGFSLISCKNVLLHFAAEQRVQVIRMFHRALAPGGYFVTEHTQKMPSETAPLFEQVVSNAQLFRRREAACA